jgi:hypothetical protein
VAKLTKEFGQRIKLITQPVNNGFASANNLGVREAHGEYLFFLNSDTLVKRDILKPLEAVLNSDTTIGIIAPGLLTGEGKEQPFAHGLFPKLSNLIWGKMIGPIAPLPERQITEVDWVSGAALIIRKDVLKLSGGWDEKYFMYFEDVDLCWQAKRQGYCVVVLNTISLIHLGGRSWQYNYAKKEKYYQSQAYFFRKNYGFWPALILKIIRWPYKTWIWLNN